MNTNSAGISKNRKISPIVPKRTDTPHLTKKQEDNVEYDKKISSLFGVIIDKVSQSIMTKKDVSDNDMVIYRASLIGIIAAYRDLLNDEYLNTYGEELWKLLLVQVKEMQRLLQFQNTTVTEIDVNTLKTISNSYQRVLGLIPAKLQIERRKKQNVQGFEFDYSYNPFSIYYNNSNSAGPNILKEILNRTDRTKKIYTATPQIVYVPENSATIEKMHKAIECVTNLRFDKRKR